MADYYSDTSIQIYGLGHGKPKIGPIGLAWLKSGMRYFDESGQGHMSSCEDWFCDAILAQIVANQVFGKEHNITMTRTDGTKGPPTCLVEMIQVAFRLCPEMVSEEMYLTTVELLNPTANSDIEDVRYEIVIEIAQAEPGADIEGFEALFAATCSKPRHGEFFGGSEFVSDIFTRYTNAVTDLSVSQKIHLALFEKNQAEVAQLFYQEYLQLTKGVNAAPGFIEAVQEQYLQLFQTS